MKRHYGLDTLRVISLIGILLYHFSTITFRGGYLFVNAFLMLSGFLITKSLFKNIRSKRLHLGQFYRSKALRLLPPLFLSLVIGAGFAGIFAPVLLKHLFAQVTSAMTLTNNIWQIIGGQSYFEAIHPLLFSHLWFLGIEGQFLLIWPLVIGLLNKYTNQKQQVAIFGALTILSMVLMAVFTEPNADNTYTYYHTLSRLYAITIGAGFAVILTDDVVSQLQSAFDLKKIRLLEIGLLIALSISAHFIRTDFSITYYFLMQLHTLLLGLVFVVMYFNTSISHQIGKLGVIQFLSDRSYEWYLFSFPIFLVISYIMPDAGLLKQVLITLLIIFVLTEIYRFFANALNQNQMKITTVLLSIILLATFFIPIPKTDIDELLEMTKDKEDAIENQDNSAISSEPMSPEANVSKSIGMGNKQQNLRKMRILPDNTGIDEIYSTIKLSSSEEVLVSQIPLTMIGDSVTLMSHDSLLKVFPKMYNDSAKSRQFAKVNEQIEQLKQKNKLNPIVIIHLGANGYIHENDLKQALDSLKGHSVFLINNVSPKLKNEEHNNGLLKKYSEEYDHVYLIDWYSYARNKGQLFYSDRVHPKLTKGTDIFSYYIARNIIDILYK